ncbi:MAG: HAD family hydrolase [Defluviitaleaceae bacterium]|nr:HAD family hydrolase [Defluviitaleaceae bacterium]MCL2274840.1 HAD family hydrolase [Defluviitaleaceae bacterium]
MQLIVTDLDRTLLHTDKTLSAYTIDVLNRCREKGNKLAFASARPYCNGSQWGIMPFAQQLPTLPDALITTNGAEVYIGNQRHAHFTIAPKDRDFTLHMLAQKYPNVFLFVEIGEEIYGDVSGAKHGDFSNLPDEGANMIFIEVESIDDVNEIARHLPADLRVEMSHGEERHSGLIMHKNAGKWSGVQTAAQFFGIPTENIITFGDDFIDMEMLQHAGTGIAVANAMPEIKAVANFICDTNDNDGVARWLEENLLCK